MLLPSASTVRLTTQTALSCHVEWFTPRSLLCYRGLQDIASWGYPVAHLRRPRRIMCKEHRWPGMLSSYHSPKE